MDDPNDHKGDFAAEIVCGVLLLIFILWLLWMIFSQGIT